MFKFFIFACHFYRNLLYGFTKNNFQGILIVNHFHCTWTRCEKTENVLKVIETKEILFLKSKVIKPKESQIGILVKFK